LSGAEGVRGVAAGESADAATARRHPGLRARAGVGSSSAFGAWSLRSCRKPFGQDPAGELRQAENDRAGGARRTREFWEEDFQ